MGPCSFRSAILGWSAILLVSCVPTASAQDDRGLTGIERSGPATMRIGACVYQAAVTYCPSFSSTLEECEEAGDLTVREAQLLRSQCLALSRETEFTDREVRIEIVAVSSGRRDIFRVTISVVDPADGHVVETMDRSGRPLRRIIQSVFTAIRAPDPD